MLHVGKPILPNICYLLIGFLFLQSSLSAQLNIDPAKQRNRFLLGLEPGFSSLTYYDGLYPDQKKYSLKGFSLSATAGYFITNSLVVSGRYQYTELRSNFINFDSLGSNNLRSTSILVRYYFMRWQKRYSESKVRRKKGIWYTYFHPFVASSFNFNNYYLHSGDNIQFNGSSTNKSLDVFIGLNWRINKTINIDLSRGIGIYFPPNRLVTDSYSRINFARGSIGLFFYLQSKSK